MPLNEQSASCLKRFVKYVSKSDVLVQKCQQMGPKELLDTVLYGNSVELHIDDNISENRDEAEQLLAGLLGMY